MTSQSFKSQSLTHCLGVGGRGEKKILITIVCLRSVSSLQVTFGQTFSVIPTGADVVLAQKVFIP